MHAQSFSFAISTYYFLDTFFAIAVSFLKFSINLGRGVEKGKHIVPLYPRPHWLFEQAEKHDLSRCPRIKNTSVAVLPGLVQSPRSNVDIVARLQNIHLKRWIETKNIYLQQNPEKSFQAMPLAYHTELGCVTRNLRDWGDWRVRDLPSMSSAKKGMVSGRRTIKSSPSRVWIPSNTFSAAKRTCADLWRVLSNTW